MNIATDLLSLADGTKICAPIDIKLMSNFVLREQQDWFEDEIHFVRRLISPGMHALDIGANYGVYSMAIAKQLAGEGHLWCFEPTPNTAAALRRSVTANQFDANVSVLELGLSAHAGEATFYASENAELNSLHTQKQGAEAITIRLQTLDACEQEYNWPAIDFIKLDAEGEEVNILQGAEQLLESHSPLIMFELKHGDRINTDLLQAFTQSGYGLYRLLPGLGTLVPFTLEQNIDTFMLNLFACKPDMAAKLEARDLLVTSLQALPAAATTTDGSAATTSMIGANGQRSDDADYQQSLDAYLAARNEALPMTQRAGHLAFAFEGLKRALQAGESHFSRLSTYGRIAFDLGQRQIGLRICDYMVQRFVAKQHPIALSEAFVPLVASFDQVAPAGQDSAWGKAMILDAFIRQHAFSCYFTGSKALPLFAELQRSGFMQADMRRRLDTLRELTAAA